MSKKVKFVTARIPEGSLVIPKWRIKETLRIVFKAGLDCYKLHPDDDSYDEVALEKAVKKIMKEYNAKPISK